MSDPVPEENTPINNIICISDIHSGCRLALCPIDGVALDDGGTYMPSSMQQKLHAMWTHFWDVWVPAATRGEPYDIVMNGDALNGVPHKAITNISNNWTDQKRIAKDLLLPRIQHPQVRNYYHVRGTEAHVGKSAEHEEDLAEQLGAVASEDGMYARYELWKEIGQQRRLVHFLHHIGTTGSNAYEATAVHKELTEELVEAARWEQRRPDVIVRSHRHRHFQTTMPAGKINPDGSMNTITLRSVVTPAWQAKTPFTWKIAGARLALPQFGGVLVRESEDRELFTREKVWTIPRPKIEV